jgi:autotransporter-associated beta strand protein
MNSTSMRAIFRVILSIFTALNLSAATFTWTGGGAPNGSWSTAANWGGATPPTFSSLVFDGNTQTLSTNNLSASTSLFNGITFASSAGVFTLSGNQVRLYGATNDNNIGIANNSAAAQTVRLDLFIGPGLYRFTNAPGGSLALNGTLSSGGGITWFGPGTFTSASVSNDVSGLIAGLEGTALFGITGTAGGFSSIAAMSGGAISAYSYPASAQFSSGTIGSTSITTLTNLELTATPSTGTTVQYNLAGGSGDTFAETILIGGGYGNAAGTATIQVGPAAPSGTLRLGAVVIPSAPLLPPPFIGGIYVPNPGAGNKKNVVIDALFLTTSPSSTSSGGIIVLAVNGTTVSNQLVVNSKIIDSTASIPVTIVKAGNGSAALFTGNNSYSGGTYVDDGYLFAASEGVFGSGPVSIYRNATVFFNADGPWTNSFFISPGTGAFNGGAITIGGGPGTSKTVAGSLTLWGPAVTNAPGDRIVGSTNGTATFTGKIAGGGTLELFSGTNNTTAFILNNPSASASNNWTGGLIINAAGSGSCTLSLGANNQLASNNVILLSSNGVAQLDLNGFNDTIGSLSSIVSGQTRVLSSSSATLTVGAHDASGDFGGPFGGALNVVKIGTGTQTLSGASTTTGTLTVNAGKVVLTGLFTSASGSLLAKAGSVLAGGPGISGGGFSGAVEIRGTVSPGDDNVVGTLTAGSLTLSNATLNVDLRNSSSDRLTVNHNLTAFGTNLIQTVPVTTNLSSGQQITIITYSGTLTGNSNNFALLPPPAGYSFSIVDPLTTPGAIKLSVDIVPPKPQPGITNFSLLGTNLVVQGTNAIFGGTYYVLTSTNIALPLSNWTAKSSNLWNGSNSFTFNATNAVTPGAPQQFYILQVK